MAGLFNTAAGDVPTAEQINQPGHKAQTAATTSSAAFGTTEAIILTVSNFVFEARRAYKIAFGGGWDDASGTPTRVNPRIRKTNASGTMWIDFGWQPLGSFASGTVWGNRNPAGYVRRAADTDLTATFVLSALVDTGTLVHFANSTLRRWLVIEDVGSDADFGTTAFDVT